MIGEETKKIVNRGIKRKYYRFRATKFYGGCATADCVGCNLNCIYCWAKKPRDEPGKIGRFYAPEEVAEKLIKIADKNGYKFCRISGTEPTLNKKHLLAVMEEIENKRSDFIFILETNGIEIGNDRDFARKLSKFKNLHVRVSLKGASKESFSKITGAKPEFFDHQLRALKFCTEEDVSCHAAIIPDFVTYDELEELEEKLKSIHPSLADTLEFERLILYPHVKSKLANLSFSF